MDTSETYIRMCWKATEIQVMRVFGETNTDAARTWEDGDWYSEEPYVDAPDITRAETISISCSGCRGEFWMSGDYERFRRAVWLPRQDQLQEMVCGKFQVMAEVIQWLYSEIAPWPNPPSEYYRSFKSFEQIWLAFVMKEKYGKRWNGEDWVSD